jgi:nucleoside-diphosphate-sugar epimerase
MGHLFILGLGYSGSFIRAAAEARGWRVTGTGRAGGIDFADDQAVRASMAQATHVLSSVPPAEGQDPVLARYGDALKARWLGYLSSTGVYGDTGGAWVDESAPTLLDQAGTGRRTARVEADSAWLSLGAHVYRLPGIYGPGRNALERVREGRAHRIDLPGQVFSRVHVEDIAAGVLAAFEAPRGVYNLADDLPSSQNAVIEEASRLLGHAPPPLLSLEQANLSPPARAFYGENRRVANGKAKRVLGWRPRYRDYRAGLAACLAGERATADLAASAHPVP